MSEASAAYKSLVDLAVRSRAHALGLPEQEEVKAFWSGVGFTLDGRKYVVPMGEVAEILEMPRFTQVPGVKSWVRGVANVRGRLMPVMDLMMFLNRQSGLQTKRRRLLVLERGELYSGLIVDEVLGMQHFPVDTYTDEIPVEYRDTQIYLKGGYRVDSDFWSVFSLFTLARDPRFLNVAS
jgi:twitching motility protein PilI